MKRTKDQLKDIIIKHNSLQKTLDILVDLESCELTSKQIASKNGVSQTWVSVVKRKYLGSRNDTIKANQC